MSLSVACSWPRLDAASKIAPYGFSLPTERNVLSFQLFRSHPAILAEGLTGAPLCLDCLRRLAERHFAAERVIGPPRHDGDGSTPFAMEVVVQRVQRVRLQLGESASEFCHQPV
jgi:hypothetical protein